MAFKSNLLRAIATLGSGGSHWVYKSEDTVATVSASGYFTSIRANLRIGDRISVTEVTNLTDSNETYVDSAELVVTSVADPVTTA